MNYLSFRSAVFEMLEKDRRWSVRTDWEEIPHGPALVIPAGITEEELQKLQPPEEQDAAGGIAEGLSDFIELEQEKGAFYVFMTVDLNVLYRSYLKDGWEEVRKELSRYTLRSGRSTSAAADYQAMLSAEDARLFEELRQLRSSFARERKIPPYFIFMNRTLYEMSAKRPSGMEELKTLYGVGEKNSGVYGQAFLDRIREFAADGISPSDSLTATG